MAGLAASSLNSRKSFVVARNRVVMLDAVLGAVLLEDVQQRDGGRIVLDQPHLWRDSHDSRNGEVQKSSGGLFVLSQKMVHHTKNLKKPFLSSRVRKTGIADNQVRVDLSVVASDVKPPGGRVVLLDNLDLGHESLDANVVVGVFRK